MSIINMMKERNKIKGTKTLIEAFQWKKILLFFWQYNPKNEIYQKYIFLCQQNETKSKIE